MATRKVTVRRRKVRDHYEWCVRRWENGRPRRTFFKAKQAADAEAAQLRAQADRAGAVWTSLKPNERESLIQAFSAARLNNIDIHQAIERAKADPDVQSLTSLEDSITELITAKSNAGRSDEYTDNLRIILDQFSSGIEYFPISKVDVNNVEKFLDSKSLASRSTYRARISTLMKFAVRRGYRPDNPCDQLESVTYHKPPPAVFSPKQFNDAWEWVSMVEPRGLSWLVLSTVCGLRPEEAEKTTEKDIHFKEGWIKVEAQTTKVRQRRVIYPKPEAMKLLKLSIKLGGQLPIDGQVRERMIQGYQRNGKNGIQRRPGLRQALGFIGWPKDITRHTAASYWLASDGSVAHVAEMLGNSELVLKRDYKALVTKAEAVDFWQVVEELTKQPRRSHQAPQRKQRMKLRQPR